MTPNDSANPELCLDCDQRPCVCLDDEVKLEHQGLHSHRLRKDQGNPREVAFAEQWLKENSTEFRAHVLATLLTRHTGDPLNPFSGHIEQLAPCDQHAASVAATVIQWLGSNVGFCFLEEALGQCGYKIVAKSGTDDR